jgi:hypothetical protein
MLLLCKLFGHHRSRVSAYFDPDQNLWKSHCRRCAIPLVRRAHGRWDVAEQESSAVEQWPIEPDAPDRFRR